MNKKLVFPKDFWWGAASSGPQSEGNFGKPHSNVMDYWFKEKSSDFFNGVSAEVASDFFHRYEQDFTLMKECGFNSYRTSIQWSRLIKNLETGEVDPEGVEYYHRVIDAAKEKGIELILNLHHFDIPIELLQKYGGWQSKHVVDLFVKFAETCFVNFGKKIKYWTTFNEPMVIPEAGWLYGFHYPKLIGKGKEAVQIIYNINLASAKVIEKYRSMKLPGKIGIILNLTPTYVRSNDEKDLEAGKFSDEFFNKIFLDPAVNGKFSKYIVNLLEHDNVLWEFTNEELKIIENNTVDFLGVNYYHPKRVHAQDDNSIFEKNWTPDRYFVEYEWDKARINKYRGWEIYPKAIYDIAKNIQNNYKNIPWYISENGMGVEGEERFKDETGFIEDDYRIDFYKEHLAWLHKAISEGSNCFGYHAWTAVDCWSWNNAYKNRYGFIAVDLKTQERMIKKSGYWYRKVSDENGFEYDFSVLDD